MIIGITGKSGSGKTTITNLLQEKRDYEVIHVDDLTHTILELEEIKGKLISSYGISILNEEGEIDRKKLGNILFSDSNKMKEYNLFIWNFIEKYIDSIIKNSNKDIIIDWMQLPLTKYFYSSDFRILVEAPQAIRKKRVQERDGITEAYFLNRENNGLEYSREDFDYVIMNEKDVLLDHIESVNKQIERSLSYGN